MNTTLKLMLGKINAEKFFDLENRAVFVESRSSREEKLDREMSESLAKVDAATRKKLIRTKYGSRQIREIVKELHDKGMTNAEISRELYMCQNNVMYHLQVLGETHKRAYVGGVRKTVLHYSHDGKLLGEYHSIADAARKLTINRGRISDCCNGVTKQHNGHVFKFGNGYYD